MAIQINVKNQISLEVKQQNDEFLTFPSLCPCRKRACKKQMIEASGYRMFCPTVALWMKLNLRANSGLINGLNCCINLRGGLCYNPRLAFCVTGALIWNLYNCP